MSTMPDGLRNGVLRQAQVPNEHVTEKRIVGALCVVTLAACTYLRHVTRYTARDAIEFVLRAQGRLEQVLEKYLAESTSPELRGN